MRKYIVRKVEQDLKPGTFWNPGSDWLILDNASEDCVVCMETGVLVKVMRGAISKELCEMAVAAYKDAGKTVSTNRGYAAGATSRVHKQRFELGNAANSGVIGYLDSSNHKRPCRLTSYSKKHFEKYLYGLPFIQKVSDCFAETLPDKYQAQKDECKKCGEFVIPNTVYSTVTVNYSFRTALHKDTGDYKQGFGSIVVIQQGVSGGMLLFPEYHVGVVLDTGDFVAANVHEWHCNSEICIEDTDGYRLSFVCYLREKMVNCSRVNERIQELTGSLSCANWSTDDIIRDIFGSEHIKEAIPNRPGAWVINSDKYCLEYKNKRYTFVDLQREVKVYNLMNAWDYVRKL